MTFTPTDSKWLTVYEDGLLIRMERLSDLTSMTCSYGTLSLNFEGNRFFSQTSKDAQLVLEHIRRTLENDNQTPLPPAPVSIHIPEPGAIVQLEPTPVPTPEPTPVPIPGEATITQDVISPEESDSSDDCWNCNMPNGEHTCKMCEECGEMYDTEEFTTCRYCAPPCPHCDTWACNCDMNPIVTEKHRNSEQYKMQQEEEIINE